MGTAVVGWVFGCFPQPFFGSLNRWIFDCSGGVSSPLDV